MFRLIDTAEAAARAILFPVVVEAQEKFRELAKSYFRIPENAIEELLAEVVSRFDLACKEFNVTGLYEQCIHGAENYIVQGLTFLTKSEVLKKSLEEIYTASREDRNILIYGESSVGKRLLAISLHHRPDNPRKISRSSQYTAMLLTATHLRWRFAGQRGAFSGWRNTKERWRLLTGELSYSRTLI